MTMSSVLGELRVAIERQQLESLIASPTVLEKCAALFSRYPQSIIEFLAKLEAFLMNAHHSTLTLELLGPFEQSLHKDSLAASDQSPSPSFVTQWVYLCLQAKSKPVLVKKEKEVTKSIPSPDVSALGKRPNTEFKTPPTMPRPALSVRAQNPSTVKKEGSQSLEAGLSQGTGIAYAERPNSGQVVLTLNPGLGERGEFDASSVKPIGMRCRVKCNEEDFDNIQGRYRFMFTTLDERARALDRHLLKLQEQLCAFANIPDGELHPVGVPSQDTVWVCGRICCEAAEGKINKSSVVLEGSRRDSAGRRVHLDLQELPAYSLFPGQVVLVEGVNSSGRRMVAKRIVEGIARPTLTSPAAKLLEYHHSTLYQGGSALSVVTAAGPFTTSDNLTYQPLQDLLMRVLQTKPDVLVLVGPFVDISQPLLSTGDVHLPNLDENGEPLEDGSTHTASYEMVFVEKVLRDCLSALYQSESDFGVSPTNIILVPSLLDAHHEFVFPQPPFGDRDRLETQYFEEPLGVLDVPFSKDGDPKKRVHLLPNPCMFRVNEVLFGVCSNDVLFSLSSDEVSLNIEGNRLARLAGHLLQQQSFSPQFPVPANLLSQYDMRQSKHWEFSTAPDVMILPSRLAALAKEVFGTLVVNPGQLTRGVGGGTFAQLAIHPHKEGDLRAAIVQSATPAAAAAGQAAVPPAEAYPHAVAARTAVTITKI